MELPPKYECADNPNYINAYKCISNANSKELGVPNWCGNSSIAFHRVNYTDPLSIHNWIEDLDLACTQKGPTSPIALLGSLQFVGWAISAFITPRLADIYGRKIIFLVSMGIQLAALIGIYFSRNWIFTAVLMFIFGTGGVGRSSISYLYMQEFLPTNK